MEVHSLNWSGHTERPLELRPGFGVAPRVVVMDPHCFRVAPRVEAMDFHASVWPLKLG